MGDLRNVDMFGEFIRKSRKKLGMSCSELARRSGHPISTINGIEIGANKNPRFRIIIDMSKTMGISLDDMRAAFDKQKTEDI